jgi:hypothetical protein
VLDGLTEQRPQPLQSPGWQMLSAQSSLRSRPSGWSAQVKRLAHRWQNPHSLLCAPSKTHCPCPSHAAQTPQSVPLARGACWQPACGSHQSTMQGLPSAQALSMGDAVHGSVSGSPSSAATGSHRSAVQATPSSQSGVKEHPVGVRHASTVHGSPSSQECRSLLSQA